MLFSPDFVAGISITLVTISSGETLDIGAPLDFDIGDDGSVQATFPVPPVSVKHPGLVSIRDGLLTLLDKGIVESIKVHIATAKAPFDCLLKLTGLDQSSAIASLTSDGLVEIKISSPSGWSISRTEKATCNCFTPPELAS